MFICICGLAVLLVDRAAAGAPRRGPRLGKIHLTMYTYIYIYIERERV